MNKKKRASFAILSLLFVSMGVSVVTPALQSISEAFPNISFTNILLINTLPVLPMIPFSIFAGMTAGSKIKYRSLVIVGLILYVAAGMIPIVISNFIAILVSRAVFGVGMGILAPLGTALILRLYDGPERADMLGIGGAVTSVGGIVLQLLGSFFCAINWHYTFLAYALGIIALVIIFLFLPEPEKLEQTTAVKVKIPAVVYLISVLTGIASMLGFPVLLNMSTIIITGNLGAVTIVGFVLAMFTVGGAVAGTIFGRVYRRAGRHTLLIGLLVIIVSMAIINYGNNLVMLIIGTALTGAGFGLLTPSITHILGATVAPAALASAMGIFMATSNLGSFVTSYYMSGLSELFGNASPKFPIFISMLIFVAGTTALFVLFNIKKWRNSTKVNALT